MAEFDWKWKPDGEVGLGDLYFYNAYHSMYEYNGIVYFYGIQTPIYNRNMPRYDTVTKTMLSAAQTQWARTRAVACGVDDKLYLFGGVGLKSVEVYDPANNTSTLLDTQMPHCIMDASAVLLDRKIYLISGTKVVGTSEVTSQDVDVYDVDNGTWSVVSPIPLSGRQYPICYSSVRVGGKIYAICSDISYPQVYMYDPAADVWTQKTPQPIHLTTSNSIAAVGSDIYMIYGRGSGVTGMFVQIYHTETDTWEFGPPLPGVGDHQKLCAIGDKLYVSLCPNYVWGWYPAFITLDTTTLGSEPGTPGEPGQPGKCCCCCKAFKAGLGDMATGLESLKTGTNAMKEVFDQCDCD